MTEKADIKYVLKIHLKKRPPKRRTRLLPAIKPCTSGVYKIEPAYSVLYV